MGRLLSIFLFFGYYGVFAQNITVVEYFFDSDPGYGNGISVSISPAASITDFTFPINISGQSDGFHTLFVRAKDANNNWSAAYSRPFYKLSVAQASPTAPNINKIEYFLDTDPGYGAGVDVPVTASTSISNFTFTIPLNGAADGFHTLFVRTRDANNNWSGAYSRPFYKLPASTFTPVPNINKLEYFFDADPGYGAGIDVPVSPAVTISNVTLPIAVNTLSQGSHILTFRTRDANGQWSVVAVKNISVCNHPGTTVSAATSITSSSFTAGWVDVPGSINYQLDVSTDNFATFVSGYNSKIITAPALSTTVTGLSQTTTYQYRVRAVASCASVQSNTIGVTTLATPPTAQPTNLLFSSVTSTSFTAFFTAPATPPTGYLAIRKEGSSPTFAPPNNTTYTIGQTAGDGIVAYAGASFLFNESGLLPDKRYYYDVFSYNQNSGFYTYLSTSPLENSVSTFALKPTAQATALQFNSVTATSFSVGFTTATGSPESYLVLRKIGSAPTGVPVDGTAYTTTVGSDVIAYQGSGTSFSEAGLIQNTIYYYSVYAYNGSAGSASYLTAAPLQGSQTTPIAPPSSAPTNLVFSSITPNSMTVSYTAALGSPSGYLVVRKVGISPAFIPQTNVSYTAGQTLSDGVVAYVGPAVTFGLTGLTASTGYFYDVFAYNQIASLISYQLIAALEGNATTFTAEPTAQATGITFSNVTENALRISFVNASPVPGSYLILRKSGSAPTSVPVDGSLYVAGNIIGDGTVVSVGSATFADDAGLQSGTTYFYQIFSINGSGATANYFINITVGNSGSRITIPGKPVTIASSGIQQNQFTANWQTVTGAVNYRIDVSTDNFLTRLTGFDDLVVNGNALIISGLSPGIAYKYQVRAVNSSGTSVNSDALQQFTIPLAPVLAPSSSTSQSGFTSNWSIVTGASSYYIDVSESSIFSTFITGYQNKSLANVTSEIIGSLTAGTRYFYRVRSANTGGTSPNSPVGSQLLVPGTPVGLDATNATTSSFKAKWLAVFGADEYRLDVTLAANNFSPSLPNYTDRVVTGITEELVLNLLPNTAYRYRIRAVNSAGPSPNSPSISVSTIEASAGGALQINSLSFSSAFIGSSIASVEVAGGTAPYSMTFYHRKITANTFASRSIAPTGTSYQTAIDASMLDELGLEFYFKIIDADGTSKETARSYVYNSIATTGTKIPFTKSGGTSESYEIFSIPYALDDNLIATIFNELGEYKKSSWRLLRYQSGKNVDNQSGINRIELGNGYWFNRKENIDIFFSKGTVGTFNQSAPFKLKLESGWNQIGNPFPFNVDWDDIRNNAPDPKLIGNLKVFNPTQFNLSEESNNLKTWSGGFVHNDSNGPVEISMPVTLKNSSGGRASADERVIINSQLDKPDWYVSLTISQEGIVNNSTGIGMHVDANISKDQFDEIVTPHFINYLDLFTRHEDYFSPEFSRDVVPNKPSYTWNLHFESGKQSEVKIQWNNELLGKNEATLLLYDVNEDMLTDMKLVNEYKFSPKENQQFTIFFGVDESSIQPDVDRLGNAYPNPFYEDASIPFFIKKDGSMVNLSVFDIMGRPVTNLVNQVFNSGIYSTQWKGFDSSGSIVSPGIYLYRMELNNRVMTKRIVKR